MKLIRNLVSIAIVSLFLGSTASAASSLEQAYVESYRGRTDVPVPVKVYSPFIASDYVGTTVTVEFTVNAKGVPENISVSNNVDFGLAMSIVDAVQFWKFNPAVRDGKAVETKVVLPFCIVDEATRGTKLAAK